MIMMETSHGPFILMFTGKFIVIIFGLISVTESHVMWDVSSRSITQTVSFDVTGNKIDGTLSRDNQEYHLII